jgi:hypothetical protein
MNVIIHDAKNKLDEAKLINFEKHIKTRLPDEYRKFLLTYNGGYPEPDGFMYIRNNIKYTSNVDFFLSLDGDEDDDIYDFIETYRNRIPPELLPIAYDSSGNLICIAILGDHIGTIYFWDHEEEYEEGEIPGYKNVFMVQPSFNKFLNNLFKI